MIQTNFLTDKRVSLFANAQTVLNPEFIPINDLLDRIKSGFYEDIVEFTRQLKNNDTKSNFLKYKQSKIPGFTLSALCNHRKATNNIADDKKLVQHTGLLQIDIDNLSTKEMDLISNKLQKDKYVQFLFTSIGGFGLKAGIQINPEYHKESFLQASKYFQSTYDIKIDSAVKDLYRLCFISDDKNLYINPKAELFIYEPNKQILKCTGLAKNKSISIDKHKMGMLKASKLNWLKDYFVQNAIPGNRHNIRAKVAYLAGGFTSGGICTKNEILDLLYKLSDSVADGLKTNPQEIKTLNDCFDDGCKFPIEFDTSIEKLEDWYSDHKRSDKNQCIEFKRMYNLPYCYWNEDLVRGQITLKINTDELFEFLIKVKGIHQIVIDGQNKARLLVNIIDNIVSSTDEGWIRNKLTNQWLEELPEQISPNFTKFELRSILRSNITRIIEKSKLDVLPIIEKDKFIRDKRADSFFFFKNGFILVNKNEITLKHYSELQGYIWDSQIIEHSVDLLDNEVDAKGGFTFTQFLKKICSMREPYEQIDNQRYEALKAVIGYLLHNYRSKSYNKAIVLMDAAICEEPQGRTGKGLIMQAVSKLRKVTTLDGRNFTFDSTFTFQNVDLDTNIIFIDDVNKRFDFHRLFSVITEGVSFEKKYHQRVILKPEKSPKIVLSSNYSLPGNSESERGRKYEMELLPYFNSEFRPCDEFNEEFFTSWDSEQFNIFFNIMFDCVQFYFQRNGIIPIYDSTTINQKKLLNATTQEFLDYMGTVARNKTITCEEFYNNFVTMYGYSQMDKDRPTNKTVSKWLQYYCKVNNIDLVVTQIKRNGINNKCYNLKSV